MENEKSKHTLHYIHSMLSTLPLATANDGYIQRALSIKFVESLIESLSHETKKSS